MKLKKKLVAIAGILLLAFTFSPAFAGAIDCDHPATPKEAVQCGANGGGGASPGQQPQDLNDTVHAILTILSIVVGIAAIFMVVFAGLKYITSGGEAEKVKSAKGTLIYAIIGLVIVALAQTIVHFVLTEANNPTTDTTNSSSGAAPSSQSSSIAQ